MKLYNELYRVAKTYYRERCGEGGWCSVIAVAVATGVSFGKARSMLYKHGKRTNGRGAYVFGIHNTLEEMGYKLSLVKHKAPTLISIQQELANTEGTYFVYTKRHVTAIHNGICEDWSNNEYGRRTRYNVESVWKVTK